MTDWQLLQQGNLPELDTKVTLDTNQIGIIISMLALLAILIILTIAAAKKL